jgi:Zn-dependent metalloprotease
MNVSCSPIASTPAVANSQESHEHHPCCCSIIPPHITVKLAENHPEEAVRHIYKKNNERSNQARKKRVEAQVDQKSGLVTVYDARNHSTLPGKVVSKPLLSDDLDVVRAFKFGTATRDFFQKVLGRDSINNKGMEIQMSVNYKKNYANAFWDGSRLIFGDGDPRGKYQTFTTFTQDADIIAHEITHGVTQYSVPGGGLTYQGQSGALNESYSDVFGIQVKMYVYNKKSQESNWLIGEEVLVDLGGKPYALRNMLKPGTAYVDHPILGTDPQPGHMSKYLNTTDDNGGVHLNSGIPNKAFATAALELGGNAWDVAGKVWYLTYPLLKPTDGFKDMATKTVQIAIKAFGQDSPAHKATVKGWREVGVLD